MQDLRYTATIEENVTRVGAGIVTPPLDLIRHVYIISSRVLFLGRFGGWLFEIGMFERSGIY